MNKIDNMVVLKKIFIAILILSVSLSSEAKVKLPNIIGDNMVLQRNSEVKLWGMSEPGKKITVHTSWNDGIVFTKANKAGKWSVTVRTFDAGGPYDITFSDGEDVTVSNVMLGEVWYCSGQSNMEMPVKGFTMQSVEGAVETILEACPEIPIRMCNVKRSYAIEPQYDADMKWTENTPQSVADISAVAYYFAEYIQKVLDVPVGIIVASWGGSKIEAWMDKAYVSEFSEMDISFLDKEVLPEKYHQVPTLLYNGMVAPVLPFTVKGMLWYQGESNKDNPEQYSRLQPAFVAMMREKWGLGEIPFYYVQIAPYRYEGEDSVSAAIFREIQTLNLKDIPASGMVVTMDIGDRRCIHPAKKREVGRRLAYMALERDYGFEYIDSKAPVYKSMEIKGSEVIITFDAGKLGIGPRGHILSGFEVAGKDRVFHKALGKVLDRNRVRVICKAVSEPVAVRYAFHNYAEVSLFNNFGIPAVPFRTDNW